MGSVLLEIPPRELPEPRLVTEPPLHYREVRSGYVPSWSLACSLFAHLFAFVVVIALSLLPVVVQPAHINEEKKLEVLRSSGIVYLPTLGGGSEGVGRSGGATGSGGPSSSGLRARSQRGFAYPGPQPVVSNPPHATLGIQTILQPNVPNPKISHRYLPLPNIVRPAPPADAPVQQKALVVKPGRLAIRPPEKLVQAPKITLPTGANSSVADVAAAAHIAKPNLARPEVSDIPVGRGDQKGLLVLNAIPAAPDAKAKIPLTESRSLFAVTPGDSTVIADPAAGAKSGGSTTATGSGSSADVASGDALADAVAGGNAAGHGSGGTGVGSGHSGNGKGNGLNSADAGTGAGRGNATGNGVGTGVGTSAGSGSGAGSAPGSGGFPGITIKGGQYGGGATGDLHPMVASHHSYSMTIVSTASSGGGLPDFGVFSNEKVYTVYLDMSSGPGDSSPSWTLQYAPVQSGGAGTLKPPYVLLKEIPQLTADLAQKCARKLIVASAVMDASGKLEQVAVKQTPDNRLVGPLVEALSSWMFKPAELDGQPVPLKVLLGIRLVPGR